MHGIRILSCLVLFRTGPGAPHHVVSHRRSLCIAHADRESRYRDDVQYHLSTSSVQSMYRRGVRERRQVSSEYTVLHGGDATRGREGVYAPVPFIGKLVQSTKIVTMKGYENFLASRAAPRGRRGPKGNQSSKVPPAARNDVTLSRTSTVTPGRTL